MRDKLACRDKPLHLPLFYLLISAWCVCVRVHVCECARVVCASV